MSFEQQAFNFSDITAIELKGENGVFMFNQFSSPVPTICYLGKVGKKKAEQILLGLEKEYKVFSVSYFEIALVKDGQITHHFTIGGGMWNNGQWVQMLNEWDFRKLIAGQKVKTYKAPKPKKITITATERQIKKAKQLFYAKSIGFEITVKDYQKWHLL